MYVIVFISLSLSLLPPPQVDGPLHLKSHLSVAGPEVLSVGAGPEAQAVLRRVEREATHRYQVRWCRALQWLLLLLLFLLLFLLFLLLFLLFLLLFLLFLLLLFLLLFFFFLLPPPLLLLLLLLLPPPPPPPPPELTKLGLQRFTPLPPPTDPDPPRGPRRQLPVRERDPAAPAQGGGAQVGPGLRRQGRLPEDPGGRLRV